MQNSKNPLIGKFFHSLNPNGKVEWQGCVIGSPEPGLYLVKLYEWFTGQPNVFRLVPSSEMIRWLFYADAESMRDSYDCGVAREGGPYRDTIERVPPCDPETAKKLFAKMREAAE